MPIPVIMPKLEMSQETALVLEWLKSEGDFVKQGDALLSVETDKITIEVESPADGELSGIQAKANEIVPVTQIIAYLLQPGETAADIPAKGNVQSPTISTVVEKTDLQKTTHITPITARIAMTEGTDLSMISGSGSNGKITRTDIENEFHNIMGSLPGKVRATPAARKAGRKMNIRLKDIEGSGPDDRVQLKDVLSYSKNKAGSLGISQSIRLEGMRKTIAERMQTSYQSAPHIFFTTSINVFALETLRSQMNLKDTLNEGPHVSVTAIMIKFVSRALANYPILNSTLKGDEIILHPDINIGIAVALRDGLIVPVVKNADDKSMKEISAELNSLIAAARDSRLLPSDVSGGTFTISNLGQFGIEEFTAIINPGQTGILTIGAIIEQPIVDGSRVVIRPIMKITLGVDHRVLDGAVAAQFLMELKKYLENPGMILP